MGKASRRKKERRMGIVPRKAVAIASRGAVVRELQRASTPDQIATLNATVSPSKLGNAIMRKAPKEMVKGIREFQKRGKKITVSSLLEEVRTTAGFLEMCERAGVSYKWFEELAKERIEALGQSSVKREDTMARIIAWFKQLFWVAIYGAIRGEKDKEGQNEA